MTKFNPCSISGEEMHIGAEIQHQRKKTGYKSAEAFIEAIADFTGEEISIDQMRRIESDRQAPTLGQYAAIAATLGTLEAGLITDSFPDSFAERILRASFEREMRRHPDVRVTHWDVDVRSRSVRFNCVAADKDAETPSWMAGIPLWYTPFSGEGTTMAYLDREHWGEIVRF